MGNPIEAIRAMASRYPEAERAFLFGDHEVYRVRKKVYVWLGDGESGGTYVSVKLKQSGAAALMLPYVTPASYGMAKWGWIGADFPKGKFPESLVRQWIDESYRNTAPKKLLAQLDGAPPAKKQPVKATRAAPARRAASSRRR